MPYLEKVQADDFVPKFKQRSVQFTVNTSVNSAESTNTKTKNLDWQTCLTTTLVLPGSSET